MGWVDADNKIVFSPSMSELPGAYADLTESSSRVQSLLGNDHINVTGFYESAAGGAWVSAVGDGVTDDSTAINKAIVEAKARQTASGYVAQLGQYPVYFPPTPSGYVIGTKIDHLANVSLIGNSSILRAKSTLTECMVDMTESRRTTDPQDGSGYYMPSMEMAMFGLTFYGYPAQTLETLVRGNEIALSGQAFEKLKFIGYPTNATQQGFTLFGNPYKYHCHFKDFIFRGIKSTYGAFYMGAGSDQANNNVIERFSYRACNTCIMLVNANPTRMTDVNFNQCNSPITYDSNGFMSGGINPRLWLHDSTASIEGGYFDGSTGFVCVLHTNGYRYGTGYTYIPLRIRNVYGLVSPYNIKMFSTAGVFTKYTDGLEKTGDRAFTLWGDRRVDFGVGSTYYAWDGSAWQPFEVATSSYSWFTTVTTVADLPATVTKVSAGTWPKEQAIAYSSTSVFTGVSGCDYSAKAITYRGDKIAIQTSGGNWYEGVVRTKAAASITVYGTPVPAAAHAAYNHRKSPMADIDTNSWNNPEVIGGTLSSSTAIGDTRSIYLGEGRVHSFTLASHVTINMPHDTDDVYQKFTVIITGDASVDYDVAWGTSIFAKLASVPAGWTAVLHFVWNGSRAYTVNEKLVKYDSGSITLPTITDGNWSEQDISDSLLYTGDNIKFSATDIYQGQMMFSGRVIWKAGAPYVRVRVTNHTGANRSLGTNTLGYYVEREVQIYNESKMYTAEIELSNAEIKALRATPLTLIPSPGAGKWLKVHSVLLNYVYITDVLTVGAGDDLEIQYATSGVNAATIETTGWLDESAYTKKMVTGLDVTTALSNLTDNALQLKNIGGAEVGGAGTGKLRMLLNYQVCDDLIPST